MARISNPGELPAVGDDTQEPKRTRFVMMTRPQDNKDPGMELGFNNEKCYFEFGKPVEAPAALVDFFRTQMVNQVSPDEKGLPVVTQHAFCNIVDVQRPAELAR